MSQAKTAHKKLTRAAIQLLCTNKFLGELMLMLKTAEDPSIERLATDGLYIYYNCDFISSLNDDIVMGALAHEIFHNAYRHCGEEGMKRQATRDRELWDQACEYKVNHTVIDICKLKLTPDIYYNQKYDNHWNTERIYDDILATQKKPPKQKPNSPRPIAQPSVSPGNPWGKTTGQPPSRQGKIYQLFDSHIKWGTAKPASPHNSQDTIDNTWRRWVSHAMQTAKNHGNMPLGLERIIDDLLKPTLYWEQILAHFVKKLARDNYTYRRPNKRHLHRGLYYPSLYSQCINIGWAADTSGSMTNDDLSRGLAELRGILNTFPSYLIHLFACDAAIHFYDTVTPFTAVDIKGISMGGGGTSFVPVFDKIKKDAIELDALVYFTDACGTFPKNPPDYPVLWVVKGGGPVPWGMRCDYEKRTITEATQ